MRKIIMSIKNFIWSLFNKDRRTHVLNYKELVKALNEGKKDIVLDKDISCAAPLQIDDNVTIYGDGHSVYCERERQDFGKYFGMLITEAKYGDMVDFEVINSKYPN